MECRLGAGDQEPKDEAGEPSRAGLLSLVLSNEQLLRHILTQFLGIVDQLLYVQPISRYVGISRRTL
jgi:hypothetical protein